MSKKSVSHKFNEIVIDSKKVNIENIESYAMFLAGELKNRDIIIMEGGLGHGKTTLTREIAKVLKTEEAVTSPSFTIINEYNITLHNQKTLLKHIDLYRLNDYEDLQTIGLNDTLYSDGISIVEWGGKFIDFFNPPYFVLKLNYISENEREFILYKVTL